MTKAEIKRQQVKERQKQRDVVKQLKLDIKRTNTRITAVAKKYGVNSKVYEETIKGYKTGKLSKYTHITSNGILQISSTLGSQYAKTSTPSELPRKYLLRAQLSKTTTLTALERRYEEQSGLKEEELEQMTPDQKIRNVESMYTIRDKFEGAKSQFYKLFTTGFKDGGDREYLMPELFSEGSKKYKDLELYTQKMEFFAKYAENFNPVDGVFEFTSNDKISPDDIPKGTKYIIIG